MIRVAIAAAAVALVLPSLARADHDDGSVSGQMGMGVGPNGIDIRFNVNDGTQKRANASVTATPAPSTDPCAVTKREEFSSNTPGESWRLVYESDPAKRTLFKVLAPDGYGLRITDGGREVLRDTVPASFDAQPGHFYRVEIFTSEAVLFDKKFEAKGGSTASLWIGVNTRPAPVAQPQPQPPPFTPPPPAGPVVVIHQPQPHAQPTPQPQVVVATVSPCVPDGDFEDIVSEIQQQSFAAEKLGVLRSAMGTRRFCVNQVIGVIDLFTFSNEKLDALKMLSSRIVDRENNFRILSAFTFSSDKKKAEKILGR